MMFHKITNLFCEIKSSIVALSDSLKNKIVLWEEEEAMIDDSVNETLSVLPKLLFIKSIKEKKIKKKKEKGNG